MEEGCLVSVLDLRQVVPKVALKNTRLGMVRSIAWAIWILWVGCTVQAYALADVNSLQSRCLAPSRLERGKERKSVQGRIAFFKESDL